MLKKAVVILVAMILLFNQMAFAETTIEDSSVSMEEILNEFHAKLHNVNVDSFTNNEMNNSESRKIKILKDTVRKLKNNGFVAYEVTPDTYDLVQKELNTDLGLLGMNRQYLYIVAAESVSDSAKSWEGGTFYYEYEGVSYQMRHLTVTAADDPLFTKTSDVNILNSYSKTVIKNCLDAAVTYVLDYATGGLGTIASILGLSISNFSTTVPAIMRLMATTSWTRVYTQVWNSYYGAWSYGSCVEYAHMICDLYDQHYDPIMNAGVSHTVSVTNRNQYSARYYDDNWKWEQAVLGQRASNPVYDKVGTIRYKHGNTVKITHIENF